MLFDMKQFEGVRALVVGDFIIDMYHFGHADRLSPEAPVPVFVSDRVESRPGGAGNVAAQLEALGCIIRRSCAPVISVKRRFLVGHQQVFRHDSDVDVKPEHDDIGRACVDVAESDVVVLSDYNKGWLSYAMCQRVIEQSKERKIPVVVDPKMPKWDKFWGAEVMCPNTREMNAALLAVAETNCRPGVPMWDGHVVEKRAEKGLRIHHCFDGEGGAEDVPATAQKVFDVTGAGDIVTAVIAACAGANKRVAAGSDNREMMSMLSAARLANLAAGYTVGQIGTAVCPKEKLEELACGLDL